MKIIGNAVFVQSLQKSVHTNFQHKVELVNLVLSGMTPSALSEFVCESKNTITLWVKTADEKGFDALRTKKQTGRPSKLSAENIASIKSVLEEDNHIIIAHRFHLQFYSNNR